MKKVIRTKYVTIIYNLYRCLDHFIETLLLLKPIFCGHKCLVGILLLISKHFNQYFILKTFHLVYNVPHFIGSFKIHLLLSYMIKNLFRHCKDEDTNYRKKTYYFTNFFRGIISNSEALITCIYWLREILYRDHIYWHTNSHTPCNFVCPYTSSIWLTVC